jgi:subtilisin family serine protease
MAIPSFRLAWVLTLVFAATALAAEPVYDFRKWEFAGNTFDCSWPYRRIELDVAHGLFPSDRRPGEGVVVGIVDTGYLPTESLISDGSLPLRGVRPREFDFGSSFVIQNHLEGGEPYDVNPHGVNNGHGTMVANIIGGLSHSSEIQKSGWKSVAPWVRLLPIRVTNDVLVYNGDETTKVETMANGILSAVHGGAQVVNVSLAALHDFNGRIRRALETAERRGVIVVSASAQFVPFSMLPYPGRVPTVVSVTASTPTDTHWQAATNHSGLKVAAPGVDMCAPRAGVMENGFILQNEIGKQMKWGHIFALGGRGTTYSSALVSGAAALWLSYHGSEKIAARYGKQNIAKVFRHVLFTAGVDTPEGWDTQKAGSGILNVRRLLLAPLP